MSLDFILRHFPSPEFLKPQHIGISFSDHYLKAIVFDKNILNTKPECLVVPLEKGTIVSGMIMNADVVGRALSEIKNKFNNPFVFFTIPDELAYIFSVSLPVGSSLNLKESVAFTIEENVPLALNDTVFDYIPVKVVRSDAGAEASLVVAACVKKELEKYISILNTSGFDAIGAIHESEAVSRALNSHDFSGNSCVVQAKQDSVGIYFSKDGVVYFSTTRSIIGTDYLGQFLDEYKKFLEYCLKYNDNNQNKYIQTTLVCGEFERAKNIVGAINDSYKETQVKLGNVWTNVLKIEENTPSIPYEDSLRLAAPIGAVLSDIL